MTVAELLRGAIIVCALLLVRFGVAYAEMWWHELKMRRFCR